MFYKNEKSSEFMKTLNDLENNTSEKSSNRKAASLKNNLSSSCRCS